MLGLLVYLFLHYVNHSPWETAITWGFIVLALTGRRTETRIIERVSAERVDAAGKVPPR
jgi:hypothetical protein